MTVDLVKELREGEWCVRLIANGLTRFVGDDAPRRAALHIEDIRAENERLKALLRQNFCPRPANNRPDHFEIGACIDADECGCINCDAGLRSSTETDR